MRSYATKSGFYPVSSFVLTAALLVRMSAYAGSGAWIYDSGNSTWSTASRWNPAVVPGTAAGDVVYFTNNITANRVVTIDATSRTVGALLFGDVTTPFFNFTLAASGGATLTFDNGGADANLIQTNSASTSDSVSAPLVLTDNLSVTNRGSLAISAAVSGIGKGITKAGAGLLSLSGANTYSGGTVVNGGVLSFLKTGSLPGSGVTTVANAGTLALGVGGSGAFGSADVDALYTNTLSNVSLSASSVAGVDTTLGSFTYASTLSGSRGFAKVGGNNLILPVANSHTGPTLVYGGVLDLEHANALPGGIGTAGGTSALVFSGGVLGLGFGDFTRSLASAGTATGVNFTGPGGWAAFNADRVVNLGGNATPSTIVWGTANTGFNGQRLLLSAPTATHTVELKNPLNMGSSGTRTVQVDDGAAAIDAVISAPISGTSGSSLAKSGSGTLALTAVNTYAGQTWLNGGGTLLMTGTASIGTAGSNTLTLGQQYYGAGTLQYASSATSYFSTINISQSNSATGTLNQTSGTISVSGSVNLSPTADCVSFLNLSGGTLAVGGTLGVGQRGNDIATMTLSGSAILTAGAMIVADIANPSSPKPSYGQFIQNGGTATVGSLLITKTSTDTNPHVGTFYLNGGTFSTASITGGVATAGGVNTSIFHFNGGTLKATAGSAVFMQNLTAADVKDGGAVIDTDGYDITIAQPLLHAAGATASPLIKNGSGNLTLTGTNTMQGPVAVNNGTLTFAGATQLGAGRLSAPIVNNGLLVFSNDADLTLAGMVSGSGTMSKSGAGTLTLSGATPYSGDTIIGAGKLVVMSGGSLSNSAVSFGAGTTLALKVLSSDALWSCKSLTMGGGAVMADFHFYGATCSETVAPVLVNGDLVNNSTLMVTLNGAAAATGTYPLISYTGSLTGSGSLGAVTLPNGGAGILVNNTVNKTIDLLVTTAAAPLVWNGDSGDWDIGVTANWTGFRTTYLDGDLVLFDDTSSGAGPFTVTLPASVSPNNVLFNNSAKAYSLAGPGSLSGDANIFKMGAGALALAGPNTSSGGLTLDSGAGPVTVTLAATQDGLGAGPVNLGAGTTLLLDNTNTTSATVAKANAFGGSGLLKVSFATNTLGRATTLTGLSGFAGTVQVGSAASSTGDKLDVRGAEAPDAAVQIAEGHTLQVGSGGAPVRFGGLSVRGSGNAETRGAIRMAAGASSLTAPITLLGDTTIASDAAGATLSGPITGTAAAGATNVLTQGTTASAAGLTVSGAITDGANGGLVALTHSKGILTLTGNSTYSGGTIVNGGGTLQLGVNDALPVSRSVVLGGTNGMGNGIGNLTLGNFSQTLNSLTAVSVGTSYNTLTVAPGQSLAISGSAGIFVGVDAGVGSETRVKMTGGGALALTHADATVTLGKGQFDESGTGTGVLDLSELSSVALGSGAAPISEVRVAYGQMSSGTLTLSNTNNLITATTLRVGDSLKLNAGTGMMILGAGVNTLAVDTNVIGLYKGVGTLKFASQAAGSPGTVTIGGRTRETADFVIGSKGGMPSGAVPVGTLDLRGHVANIQAGSVTIGREDNSSASIYTGGAAGALYFDGGSFSVSNLVMAYKSGINTGVNAKATATLTVSGGDFTIKEGGSFTFATQSGTGAAYATLNLNGGTFRTYTDILPGTGACTNTINLSGGTLDLTRHVIGQGERTVTAFNLQSGTLMNLEEFNSGASLVKTGSGTLTLDGTNTYAGATIVSNGVLRLTGGACLPPTAELYLSTGASCQLDYTGTLFIHALYIDGVRRMGTRYGQANLPDFFSGTGFLLLPLSGTLLQVR